MLTGVSSAVVAASSTADRRVVRPRVTVTLTVAVALPPWPSLTV